MKSILVTYTTQSGSTAEVASAIADQLTGEGNTVTLLPIAEVSSLQPFDAVVLGAPMILGWHRAASGFLRRFKKELQTKPLACFATAVSLTNQPPANPSAPLFLDPNIAAAPAKPGRLSIKERYALPQNYIRPMVSGVRPVAVAIFGGKLELFRLPWYQALFVMAIIRATPGDRRNWAAIREWANGVGKAVIRGCQP